MSEEHEHGVRGGGPEEHGVREHGIHGAGEHQVVIDRVPEGVWVVHVPGSQVNFRTRSLFGLIPVSGLFERFGGELRTEADGSINGQLAVCVASIRTGIDRRDQQLRSPEFFGAAEYPTMIFSVESIEPHREQEMRFSSEDRLTLSGHLQIRETRIPLAFPVTVIRHAGHLHIEGKVRIDHHAAGLGWTRPGMIGKTVRADVALTLNPETAGWVGGADAALTRGD